MYTDSRGLLGRAVSDHLTAYRDDAPYLEALED
jgi:hypothetical protein